MIWCRQLLGKIYHHTVVYFIKEEKKKCSCLYIMFKKKSSLILYIVWNVCQFSLYIGEEVFKLISLFTIIGNANKNISFLHQFFLFVRMELYSRTLFCIINFDGGSVFLIVINVITCECRGMKTSFSVFYKWIKNRSEIMPFC